MWTGTSKSAVTVPVSYYIYEKSQALVPADFGLYCTINFLNFSEKVIDETSRKRKKASYITNS